MRMHLLRSLLTALWIAPQLMAQTVTPLCSHIRSTKDLGELRDVSAAWEAGVLTLSSANAPRYAWAVLPAPKDRWDLARHAHVEAEITNRGTHPVDVLLWVVGDRGWDAVPDAAKLAPGETRKFICRLRDAHPDGTSKIDPTHVKHVQVMLPGRVSRPIAIELRGLVATGEAPEWKWPPGRLELPPIEDAAPTAGRRVRYRLAGDEESRIHSLLYLPQDWTAGGSFPLIVEYPGNIFFTPGCYSTGLPDQCVIGYGMTKGKGALWLSLPFVDRAAGDIAENSWGNPDDTAEYAIRAVDEICTQFGGDRRNVVLTGFSRGALACGYIGLRSDRIAALWKGIHACQHYDGDGWHGATMDGALERARRFRGRSVFQTDNSEKFFRPVMEAMSAEFTFVKSGLGSHATAMFLDDRPSTQQLQKWFSDLVSERKP